eukprot:COSAG06_NODE_3218_length_5663_cov_8.989216_10_plen_79_part_00
MYSWRLIVARYGFWDADQDDDAAFDRRLGAVLREVGDRGKLWPGWPVGWSRRRQNEITRISSNSSSGHSVLQMYKMNE